MMESENYVLHKMRQDYGENMQAFHTEKHI